MMSSFNMDSGLTSGGRPETMIVEKAGPLETQLSRWAIVRIWKSSFVLLTLHNSMYSFVNNVMAEIKDLLTLPVLNTQ